MLLPSGATTKDEHMTKPIRALLKISIYTLTMAAIFVALIPLSFRLADPSSPSPSTPSAPPTSS